MFVKYFETFLQFSCCIFDFQFYIWDIFKKYFFLANINFGRVLHMPKTYNRESHKSSINGTSNMKLIWLMFCFHTKYMLNTLKHLLHFFNFIVVVLIFSFISGIFSKIVFHLAHVIFSRILHMPQNYVRVIPKRSINGTSKMKHT